MGDPYKGKLTGHTLVRGGKPLFMKGSDTSGVKKCSCGEWMFCASTNDARIWHRQHKADVVDRWAANGIDDRGNEVHL